MVAVLGEGSTLNLPERGYPATSVSTNYERIYSAHFPGASSQPAYGHYVFAIFPRPGLRFTPAIPPGEGMDLYGASREIQEFHTEDPIYSQDALLIASEEEYGWLKRARPSGREEALKVLDRTEDEQQEWENRAYEHARIALGLPVEPGELRGIHLNGLYEMLLAFRAESEIDRGMLWHFKSHPEDEKILLTGEFVGWASDEDSGAIVMRRISRCHWAAVVPEVSPRPDPYAFKFVVEREGNRRWANGLYPVDHHDPYKNSLISVSGQETYFQKEAAAQRLRAIEQSLTPGPEDSGLRYGQKVGGDWGRERGSGVTEAQVRADRERERRIALGPQVYDSLERISQAARHKEQPDILKTAQEFIENRPPSAHRSRRVYVADLSDLWGYPIHERDSLCVSRDLLQDPRELDLTLSRQLGALLHPERAGADHEKSAQDLLALTIVHVTMEMLPYARRGGVADVLHGLPLATSKLGQRVIVLLPFYSNMDTDLLGIASTGKTIQVGPENVEIMRSQCGGVEVYLLKNPTFGERPYQGEHLRALVLFSQSVFAALKELGLKPDLIHCHDWHTGLVPGYALDRQDPYFEKTAVVFTVHNLGYRGWFPHNRFVDTGLSPHILPLYDDEDDGFSLLKGGILCAGRGRVNTVSPNYAREIVETELGWGMQEVLQQVEVFGILNGIDYQVYDPARDRDILSNYGSDHFIAARRYNKRALQSVTLATLEDDERAEHLPELMPGCALEPDPDAFLIGMIARVAEQKGLGVMVEGLKLLLEGGYNVQFIFNGQPASQGDEYCREVIQLLHPLIRSYPHRILIRFSDEFDKLLGQRMYAGCDALVCTPLYEPCGLEPMKCHRYGCIPIARATGGLVDQVRDFDAERCPEGNGFLFKEFEAWAVSAAIKRAMDVFFHRKSEWYRLVERCMKIDNSWLHSARDYLSWYYHVSI